MEFRIVKNGLNNFTHFFDNKDVNISDFEVILNTGTFVIECKNGANIPASGVNVTDIILNAGSGDEFFSDTAELRLRLEAVGYTAYLNNISPTEPTTWGTITGSVNEIIEKTTIVDNDTVIGGDSEAGGVSKRWKFSTIKNWLNGLFLPLTGGNLTGALSINNSTPQAILDVVSTTSGVLIPRMTTTQKNAIVAPVTSMQLFDTTLQKFQYWNGSTWVNVSATPNLQQVTDVGNQTNKNIILNGHTVNQGINWSLPVATGGNEALQIQATVDATTSTTDVSGVFMNFPTTGANSNIDGAIIRLSPGYTGNKTVRALNAHSLVAGGMTLNLLDESGTIGGSFQSQGNSTGDNIGVYGIGGFAQGRNIAGYFRAMQDNATVTSTHQIGVMGIAGKHDNLSGNFIGGYFGLMSHHDHRTFLDKKAALIANNGDIDASIFTGKSVGIDVFDVKSKGNLEIKPSATNVIPLAINMATGQSTDFFSANVNAVNKFRISQSADIVMAGRLLFQENAGATTVQAMYSESGTNHLALRAGPTSNFIAIKRADASTIGSVRGATSTFVWGSSFNSGTIASPPTDGMLIQGKVGIGTTTPSEQLEVSGNAKFDNNVGIGTAPVSYAALVVDGSSTTYGIDVTSTSAGNVFRDPAGYLQQSSILLRSVASSALDIQSSTQPILLTTNGSERARVSSTGNFGINQTNPTEKLDVVGNGKFTGDVEITDSAKGIILKDTVLGTRHRIQLVSGVLTVSAAL